MPGKNHIMINIDTDKKKEFQIACIYEEISMTDKLNELIEGYLKNNRKHPRIS